MAELLVIGVLLMPLPPPSSIVRAVAGVRAQRGDPTGLTDAERDVIARARMRADPRRGR